MADNQTLSRLINKYVPQGNPQFIKDYQNLYQKLLDQNADSSEYDILFQSFLKDAGIDPVFIEPFKDIVWSELTSSDGEGFKESFNPFIQFLRLSQNKVLSEIERPQYAAIHNAYVNNVLSASDLRGKGEDKMNHIIFNHSLYERIDNYNDMLRLLELYNDWSDISTVTRMLSANAEFKDKIKNHGDVAKIRDAIFYNNRDGKVRNINGIEKYISSITNAPASTETGIDDRVKRNIEIKDKTEDYSKATPIQNISQILAKYDKETAQKILQDITSYLYNNLERRDK